MLLTFGTGTARIQGIPTARKIVFRNTGPNTVYWGFEPTTSAAGPAQGVPLLTDDGFILDGDGRIGVTVYFAAAAGGNFINYTQQL